MSEKCFIGEYNHDGHTFGGIEIWAEDWQAAERKLRSLQANARIIGHSPVTVRVPAAAGNAFVRLLRWWRGE